MPPSLFYLIISSRTEYYTAKETDEERFLCENWSAFAIPVGDDLLVSQFRLGSKVAFLKKGNDKSIK